MRFTIPLFLLAFLPMTALALDPAPASSPDGYIPRIIQDATPYLPDFSYAGYHWGEREIPRHPVTHRVTDYGAIPDDGKDDTAGILAAVKAAHDATRTVVVAFPPGRFILRQILNVERSHFVLQGSGRGKDGTIIELPDPLWDMNFDKVANQLPVVRTWLDNNRVTEGTIFAYNFGIIWTRLPAAKPIRKVAHVISGKRGAHDLIVDASTPLQVGQVYRLTREDKVKPGTLLEHVMDGKNVKLGEWTKVQPIWELVTIMEIKGRQVRVKEAMLHDSRPEWINTLSTTDFLEEIGIENLRFECPNRKSYPGHLKERGYNPICLSRVRNGWIRNIAIDNADSGILSQQCSLVTMEDIHVTGEIGAHYGIHQDTGDRCLVRNFVSDLLAQHVVSFNTLAHGCVYSGGTVRLGRLDQHAGLNCQNLYDNIRVKLAETGFGLFGHGGSDDKFPLHAAFNTYWNIRMEIPSGSVSGDPQPLQGPTVDGDSVRLVCIRANLPIHFEYYNVNPWIEGTNQIIDEPYESLYSYQMKRRIRLPR